MTAVIVSFTYNFIDDEGLLLRKLAVKDIQKAYQTSFESKVVANKANLTEKAK